MQQIQHDQWTTRGDILNALHGATVRVLHPDYIAREDKREQKTCRECGKYPVHAGAAICISCMGK